MNKSPAAALASRLRSISPRSMAASWRWDGLRSADSRSRWIYRPWIRHSAALHAILVAGGRMSVVLPPAQTGPAAWYGPDMAARDEWLMPLTPADIREIERAAAPLAARDADIAAISAADFPLPSLGARLRARIESE